MSLPPCVCPDPHGPSGCTCVQSQGSRQWLGHPYPGQSALFVNPSTTGPSPFTSQQFHSATTFHHDPRSFHGTQDIQHPSFPNLQTPYNNTYLPNLPSQFQYYQPLAAPNAALPATQGIPSPSKGRKRKNNTTGQGGSGRKRQRQPAPIVTAPVSAICGVGPPIVVVPTESQANLPDNGPPSSSPQLPTITVEPPSNLLPAPLVSTQLPSSSYSSLQANRKPRDRSSAATDIWYFCRSSDSELRPANLLSPDQEPTLTKKPRSPYVSCKLCKYVLPFFTVIDMVLKYEHREWQVYKNTDGITTTVQNHLKLVTITPYLSRDTTYCYRHCKGISRFPLLLHHPSPRPMPDRITSTSLTFAYVITPYRTHASNPHHVYCLTDSFVPLISLPHSPLTSS